MDNNRITLASIIGALVVVLLMLPIALGGTGSALFWVVFWLLALYLAATIIFAVVNRRRLH